MAKFQAENVGAAQVITNSYRSYLDMFKEKSNSK